MDGGWGPWKVDWVCLKTCGLKMSSEVRFCDSPKPKNGGTPCEGEAVINATDPCPSDPCGKYLVHV